MVSVCRTLITLMLRKTPGPQPWGGSLTLVSFRDVLQLIGFCPWLDSVVICGLLNPMFQIRKGVRQGCILSPCLFNFYAEYIMRNTGLEEAQAGIEIAGRNINNLRSDMQMTPPLWQRVKRN